MSKEEKKDEMKNKISMALKDPILQQCFEIICKNLTELEKENAELKDDNKVMADNYSKMEQKFYNNLTKAKEIIALGLRVCETSSIEYMNLYQKQAELFLEKVK